MLDYSSILPFIDDLGVQSVARRTLQQEQMVLAERQAAINGDPWIRHHRRILQARTIWLSARPLDESPIASTAPLPDIPDCYTALATDGSQIDPDRHSAVAYFVINVGKTVISYGNRERASLTRESFLFYKDEDIFTEGEDGEMSVVGEGHVARKRQRLEAAVMSQMIKDHAGRSETVALMDGTLILWAQEAEQNRLVKDASIAEFCKLLDTGFAARIPVAGYISSPGSRDVVNALRVTLCPELDVVCRSCPYDEKPCRPIDRITDSMLFSRLLLEGQRSAIYASRSKVLKSYVPEHNAIGFFYMRVGPEIVRIEAPTWVLLDSVLLDRVHAVCYDQARKGRGYPIALQEAHEHAVVRSDDRLAFERLVERSLTRQSIPYVTSRKAVSKQAAII